VLPASILAGAIFYHQRTTLREPLRIVGAVRTDPFQPRGICQSIQLRGREFRMLALSPFNYSDPLQLVS
jgi:hypothetical protein